MVATLARMLRDVGLAEELAQDALVAALEQWPAAGVPDNPGAWLTAVAKHRALDRLRRGKLLESKHGELGRELDARHAMAEADFAEAVDAALDDDIGDDLLRLVFTACHPVLATEARVPFEVPRQHELAGRLDSVLEVIYLVFNEGYAATAGDDWMRPALCEEALRLGRIVAGLMPQQPEVPRAGGAGAGRGVGRCARPLCLAGGDRRLPRAGAQCGADRLAAHCRAV